MDKFRRHRGESRGETRRPRSAVTCACLAVAAPAAAETVSRARTARSRSTSPTRTSASASTRPCTRTGRPPAPDPVRARHQLIPGSPFNVEISPDGRLFAYREKPGDAAGPAGDRARGGRRRADARHREPAPARRAARTSRHDRRAGVLARRPPAGRRRPSRRRASNIRDRHLDARPARRRPAESGAAAEPARQASPGCTGTATASWRPGERSGQRRDGRLRRRDLRPARAGRGGRRAPPGTGRRADRLHLRARDVGPRRTPPGSRARPTSSGSTPAQKLYDGTSQTLPANCFSTGTCPEREQVIDAIPAPERQGLRRPGDPLEPLQQDASSGSSCTTRTASSCACSRRRRARSPPTSSQNWSAEPLPVVFVPGFLGSEITCDGGEDGDEHVARAAVPAVRALPAAGRTACRARPAPAAARRRADRDPRVRARHSRSTAA